MTIRTASGVGRRVMVCTTAVLALGVPVPPATADPAPAMPADFVVVHDVDATILQDMRYATPHNFTGTPVDGYLTPTCILTRPAAEALARAQRDFTERGYSLKVYDCYRPQRAVNEFLTWAADLTDQQMKPEFYPRVDKSMLFEDGYIAERSGHSRGSTLDVTLVALPAAGTPSYVPGQPLVDCAAPQSLRFADNSIDMGTGYDCFDPLAHTLDPRIAGDQAKNRLVLCDGMEQQGFVNYDKEWWHFTFKPAGQGEPFPDSYFDFPVEG